MAEVALIWHCELCGEEIGAVTYRWDDKAICGRCAMAPPFETQRQVESDRALLRAKLLECEKQRDEARQQLDFERKRVDTIVAAKTEGLRVERDESRARVAELEALLPEGESDEISDHSKG